MADRGNNGPLNGEGSGVGTGPVGDGINTMCVSIATSPLACERFVGAVARVDGDIEHRERRQPQLPRRAFEPNAAHVAHHRLAPHPSVDTMEVMERHPSHAGDLRRRHLLVEAVGAQHPLLVVCTRRRLRGARACHLRGAPSGSNASDEPAVARGSRRRGATNTLSPRHGSQSHQNDGASAFDAPTSRCGHGMVT